MMLWFGKWVTVRDTGVHQYQQHSRTGKRRIIGGGSFGYQPRDQHWIETGQWEKPETPTDVWIAESRRAISRESDYNASRATYVVVGESTIITTHTGSTGAGTGC